MTAIASAPAACTCPTCGAAMPAADFAFDPALGVVATGAGSVYLTAVEVAFLQALHRRAPEVVMKGALYDAVYGALPECDQPEIKIVDVMICKMRKKLKPIGIVIATSWGRGYWLDPKQGAGAGDAS